MVNLVALLRLARQAESFMMCMSLPVACYLDSGETRIIKIRIAKKNIENLKNRNVLYTQKFLALRYSSVRYLVEVRYWECPLIESPLYKVGEICRQLALITP